MQDRLLIAYGLIALLALGFAALVIVLVRRRRADHEMRYGPKTRRRRT